MTINLLNEELYSIPLNTEQYLIYAPLKRIAFIGNSQIVNELVDNINTGANKIQYQFLDEIGFFQQDKQVADEFEDKAVRYDSVILFLTNKCQLGCIYCYANSGDYPESNMTWDIAKTSIDYTINSILNRGLNQMTLGFHGGGEPTMNWEILTKAVEYTTFVCKENNIELKISGSFNGFWNSQQLSFITGNFTDISLSFDGVQHIQDLQRPTKNGKSSFDTICQSIRTIESANIRYGIRMTVTKYSVEYLAESIKFICDNFRPMSIQAEPVFIKGRAVSSDCRIDNPEIFVQQFIKAYLIAEEKNIELYYSGARINLLTNRFCLAPCKALIVTPKGHITTCFEIYSGDHPLSNSFIVGEIKDNQVFINNMKISKFFNRTVGEIPFCKDCFCKWHCAGDCAAKTGFERSISRRESDRCFINRELIKFQLINKIYKSGGLFWINNLNVN